MTPAAGEAVFTLDRSAAVGAGPDARPGGVIAALAEAAAAAAARAWRAGSCEVATVDLHVNYLRPPAGERLSATARTTGGGRSLCFCEVRVEDAPGQVCAQARATLRYRDPA